MSSNTSPQSLVRVQSSQKQAEKSFIARAWSTLRTLAGDDAYEQYCKHHREHHPNEAQLDRRAFYVQSQQVKWNGIKRCC